MAGIVPFREEVAPPAPPARGNKVAGGAPAAPYLNTEPQSGNLTVFQMLGSTIAAALGVQSSANRERDFTKGKAVHFILMGIAFTVVFVLAVIGVVNLVLP